jgi:hypothetical protein
VHLAEPATRIIRFEDIEMITGSPAGPGMAVTIPERWGWSIRAQDPSVLAVRAGRRGTAG